MAKGPKGLDRLLRQLTALPNSVRAEMADALADEAKFLAAVIQRAAPEQYGDLKASIGWCAGPPPEVKTNGAFRISSKDYSAAGKALNAAGLMFSVFAGDDRAYYARWVEFGTSDAPAGRSRDITGKSRNNARPHAATPAQPYFYPSIRAWKRPSKARVVRRANKAAKAIARLR